MRNTAWVLSILGNTKPWRSIAATILLVANAPAANAADSTVVAESGDWQAFKSDDSCSIGIGSESAFTVIYFVQRDAFALEVTNTTPWSSLDGSGANIRVAIDNRLILSRDDGFLESDVLQFILSREEVTVLLKGMSDGTRLQLAFPNRNRHGGFISLNGSHVVISAFSRCLDERHAEFDVGSARQVSSMPAFIWSESSIGAANALKSATIQVNRLNNYMNATHDTSVAGQLMSYATEINSRMEPLGRCIERNCEDLQPSEISTFRNSISAFESVMTAKGIPPVSQR